MRTRARVPGEGGREGGRALSVEHSPSASQSEPTDALSQWGSFLSVLGCGQLTTGTKQRAQLSSSHTVSADTAAWQTLGPRKPTADSESSEITLKRT